MFLDCMIRVYFGVVVIMFLPNCSLAKFVTWYELSCCFVDPYFGYVWKEVCYRCRDSFDKVSCMREAT